MSLTTLDGALNDSETSIDTTDTVSDFAPHFILVDDEVIKFTLVGDHEFIGATRAIAGSKVVAHVDGSNVYKVLAATPNATGAFVVYINADGDAVAKQCPNPDFPQVGSGSGTIDKVISAVSVNGVEQALTLPDATEVVLIDARAKVWQPNTDYASMDVYLATVLPTDDTDHSTVFVLVSTDSGESGNTEPEPGEGTVIDGTIEWNTVGYDNRGWVTLQDETDYASTDGSFKLFKNSCLFVSDGGGGTSGALEPDWTTAPNRLDTVVDGTITWTNLTGNIPNWQANTAYGISIIGAGSTLLGDWVNPVTPVIDGNSTFLRQVVLVGEPTLYQSGTTGAEEPEWDTAMDHYTLDNGLIWQTKTDDSALEQLLLNGIKPPAEGDPNVIKVVLQYGNELSLYPVAVLAGAEPAEGWGFQHMKNYGPPGDEAPGINVEGVLELSTPGQAFTATYDTDASLWVASTEASPSTPDG